MNTAIPLSDDKWRAAGKALHYVKEVLADMALSSIRMGTAVMLLHHRKDVQSVSVQHTNESSLSVWIMLFTLCVAGDVIWVQC